MIAIKVIKVAALVSVSALYVSVSVSSVGANVKVDYGSEIEDGRVALGVVKVSPAAVFDVSYVPMPTVGSVKLSTKDGSVASIGVHVAPVLSPTVGSVTVDNGAIVPYAAYEAGVGVDVSSIEAMFADLVHFVRAHSSYIDPIAVVDLFLSSVHVVFLNELFTSDAVISFDFSKPLSESVVATSVAASSVGKVFADSSAASTVLLPFVFGKNIDEPQTAADAISFTMDKPLTDAITADAVIAIVLGTSFVIDDQFTSLVNGFTVNQYAVHEHDQGHGLMSGSALVSIDFGKNVFDSVTAAGVISGFVMTKPLVDSVSADAAAVVDLTKPLAESVTTDGVIVTLGIAKALSDSVASASIIANFVIAKPLSDAASADSAVALSVSKPFGDDVTVGDNIAIGFNYLTVIDIQFTSLVNGFSVNEYAVHEHDQGHGILAGSSFVVVDLGKNVAESVTSASVITGFVITKPLSDSASASDSTTWGLTKSLADSAVAAGVIADFNVTKPLSVSVTADSSLQVVLEVAAPVNVLAVNEHQVN